MPHDIGADLSLWLLLPFTAMLLAIALLPLTGGGMVRAQSQQGHRGRRPGRSGDRVPRGAVRCGPAGTRCCAPPRTTCPSSCCSLPSTPSPAASTSRGTCWAPRSRTWPSWWSGPSWRTSSGPRARPCCLIRPLLRANSERRHTRHIVLFFIFVVCNVGGLLTPLGDPPLFLGFLAGRALLLDAAPAAAVGARARPDPGRVHGRRVSFVQSGGRRPLRCGWTSQDYVPMRIAGAHQHPVPAGRDRGGAGVRRRWPTWGSGSTSPSCGSWSCWRCCCSRCGWARTVPRMANHFSWAPIVEVAVVFAGIFATMIPALAILRANGAELGLTQPWQYFWVTGALSSFLDNAPTYLTFSAVAQGYLGVDGMAGADGHRPGGPRRARCRLHSSRPSPRARSSWAPTPTSATPRTSWSSPSPSGRGCGCPASSATWPTRPPSCCPSSSSSPWSSSSRGCRFGRPGPLLRHPGPIDGKVRGSRRLESRPPEGASMAVESGRVVVVPEYRARLRGHPQLHRRSVRRVGQPPHPAHREPGHRRPIGSVALSTAAEVDSRPHVAQEAFDEWRRVPPQTRVQPLYRLKRADGGPARGPGPRRDPGARQDPGRGAWLGAARASSTWRWPAACPRS